jgi:hypothetical protein
LQMPWVSQVTKSMVHEMKLQVHDNPLQAPCDGPTQWVYSFKLFSLWTIGMLVMLQKRWSLLHLVWFTNSDACLALACQQPLRNLKALLEELIAIAVCSLSLSLSLRKLTRW